jgi:hypothetical protein
LSSGERRAIGLLTVAGTDGARVDAVQGSIENGNENVALPDAHQDAVIVAPQAGQAQLWRILAALAPVQASQIDLAELLSSSRGSLGRRRTLVVITPHSDISAPEATGVEGASRPGRVEPPAETVWERRDHGGNWVAELLHLQASGLDSSVLLIEPGNEQGDGDGRGSAEQMRNLLARHEIPAQVLQAGVPLKSVLTFRRTRKVIRSTPTGGVVTYEVEEEVG